MDLAGGGSSKTAPARKKEEHKPYMANERPNSANNSDEVKKPKPLPFGSMLGREEMMVTGSSGMAGKRKTTGSKVDSKFR